MNTCCTHAPHSQCTINRDHKWAHINHIAQTFISHVLKITSLHMCAFSVRMCVRIPGVNAWIHTLNCKQRSLLFTAHLCSHHVDSIVKCRKHHRLLRRFFTHTNTHNNDVGALITRSPVIAHMLPSCKPTNLNKILVWPWTRSSVCGQCSEYVQKSSFRIRSLRCFDHPHLNN